MVVLPHSNQSNIHDSGLEFGKIQPKPTHIHPSQNDEATKLSLCQNSLRFHKVGAKQKDCYIESPYHGSFISLHYHF